MSDSDIRRLGERELAKMARKGDRDTEYLGYARGMLADVNTRIPNLKHNEGINVYWGPNKVHVNLDGARRAPPDGSQEYKISYSLSFTSPDKYTHWPGRPANGVYELWPFVMTWQGKLINKILREKVLMVPASTMLGVHYMDCRGVDGPSIFGPGGPKRKDLDGWVSGTIILM